MEVREGGMQRDGVGEGERETNQVVCALEGNRWQVTASVQLCTRAKYPLLRVHAY